MLPSGRWSKWNQALLIPPLMMNPSIIVMSGLNGHPFGSFKKRGGRFMWLRDALPMDLPNARILIYGCDTSLISSESFQTIPDLGVRLRNAISVVRENVRKPLMLLGHSLGGIVMKEVSYTSVTRCTLLRHI